MVSHWYSKAFKWRRGDRILVNTREVYPILFKASFSALHSVIFVMCFISQCHMPGFQKEAWVTKDRAQCWNLLSLLGDCPCYLNFKSSLFSEHMNRLMSVLKPMLSVLKDLTLCLILWSESLSNPTWPSKHPLSEEAPLAERTSSTWSP